MGTHAQKWPAEAGLAPPAGRELEPVPVPGCDVCELLAQDREKARSLDQALIVRSCNAVMAGHPHKRERREPKK
ncbi:hypothetical protein [Streptomyces sp. 3N207]|uniref:hypothetical protein n=1 Tax=Streptomyces sp. 3N207 TaxID=3457417 RepID=UPI003FD0EDEA